MHGAVWEHVFGRWSHTGLWRENRAHAKICTGSTIWKYADSAQQAVRRTRRPFKQKVSKVIFVTVCSQD